MSFMLTKVTEYIDDMGYHVKSFMRMPFIDRDKCNYCGLCISVCRCNAIVIESGVITVIETEECGWCADCELVCPTGAIKCPYDIILGKSIR